MTLQINMHWKPSLGQCPDCGVSQVFDVSVTQCGSCGCYVGLELSQEWKSLVDARCKDMPAGMRLVCAHDITYWLEVELTDDADMSTAASWIKSIGGYLTKEKACEC